MKKTFMYIILTTALIACEEEDTTIPKKESNQFIRIQEVAEDGSTTISPVVTVKVYE